MESVGMTSAWGKAWGKAWANAWGRVEVEQSTNSAGFARLDRGHYKYKYKLEDKAVEVIEKAAQRQVASSKPVSLQNAFDRLGVIYDNAYLQVFLEIVAQLKAQQAAQDAEDEQIAMILAVMI